MPGVQCRWCGCKDCRVTHTQKKTITRKGKSSELVRRRRVCRYCGVPFFTVEYYEDPDEGEVSSTPTTNSTPITTTPAINLAPVEYNPFLSSPENKEASIPAEDSLLSSESPIKPEIGSVTSRGWRWNPPDGSE